MDLTTMRAIRAHAIDRVSVAHETGDEVAMCAECKARTIALVMLAITIGGIVFWAVRHD